MYYIKKRFLRTFVGLFLISFLFVSCGKSSTPGNRLDIDNQNQGNQNSNGNNNENGNNSENNDTPPSNNVNLIEGTKYYIDTQEDFDQYKNHTFEAGALILFTKGKSFNGQFAPLGSGTDNSPIVITAFDPEYQHIYYDEELKDGKPLINALGNHSSALELFNASNWVVSNLEIKNDSEEAKNQKKELRGIDIQARDGGDLKNVFIRYNYIHDVNYGLAGKDRGGIFIQIKGAGTKTKYNNLIVEKNKIERVGGIGVCNVSSWGNPNEPARFYPWTNYVVRDNFISYTGRNAIILRSSVDPIIEYNTVAYSSRYDRGNSIFNKSTIGCIMQYNEVYGNTGGLTDADRGAFDADFDSENTIIQYNYSHDNHWFCAIMRQANKGVIVRYNISENDILGAYFYGFPEHVGVKDVEIYNNTHYFGADKGTEVFVSAGQIRTPIETHIFNNIFYFTDKGKWENIPDSRNSVIGKNLFYNFTTANKNEVMGDPLFVNPGQGGTNIDMRSVDRLSGYKLKEGSPAINSGVSAPDNGGKDFWGNTLYNGNPDMGAFEY